MKLPCSLRSARSGVGLAVAGAILAAVSAGCSTNQADVASAQAHPGAAPKAARATVSAPPTATVPASALPLLPCQSDGLDVAPGKRVDRDGLNVTTFALTNTGSQPCTVSGSPLLTPQGPLAGQAGMEANLAVSQQDLSLPPGAAESDGITLQPGRSAEFDLGWYSESSVVCETSDGFGFDAPGDSVATDAFPVSYPFGSMCDGLFYVSPVYPAR